MKQRIISFGCLVLLMAPTSLMAEDAPHWLDRLSVGVVAGPAFAAYQGTDLSDTGVEYSYRTGIVAGCLAAIALTPHWGIQLEAEFTTKGYRADTGFPGSSNTFYIGYLEVPLLARATFPIQERFSPFVVGGPAVNILLDADTEFDDGRFFEVNRVVNPLDISLVVGAGTALHLGGDVGEVALEFRYDHGLRNWHRNPTGNEEAHNRAFYVTAGWRADLATIGRFFARGKRKNAPAEQAPSIPARRDPAHATPQSAIP